MDINGDGRKDLITGCFEGNVYMIAGLEDGTFAKPEAMKDADGELIRLGQYWGNEERKWIEIEGPLFSKLAICSHAVDFDGDGDLDLLSGSNSGHFFFRENIGSANEPKFATVATQILVDTTIKEAAAFVEESEKETDESEEDSDTVSDTDSVDVEEADGDSENADNDSPSPPDALQTKGHAMPFVVDWDGDGKFDILSGASAGGVFWARNVGTKFEPKFEQMTTLIEAGVTNEDDLAVGSRSQVCVVDFNNDGKLDIVVGDYNRSKPKEQSDEQKELMAQYTALAKKAGAITRKLKALEKDEEESDEEEKDTSDNSTEETDDEKSDADKSADESEQDESQLREEYSKILAEMTELRTKLSTTNSTRHGYVWLFEQQ